MQAKKDNLNLKVLALIFALILWFYVGVEKNPVVEHTFQVPVSVTNLSEDKTATLSTDTIRLTVRGRETRLSALNESDFHASLDLKNLKIGEQLVDVKINHPGMVKVAKTDPEKISVHIDQREGMQMPVSVIRKGTLPEGITIKQLEIKPEEVFVSGNLSILSQITSVGVEVDLSKLSEDMDKEIPVVFYDQNGNVIENEDIKAYPSRVHLSVAITQDKIEKELPIQPQLTGSLPAGYQLDDVEVLQNTATVFGTPKELAKILSVKTEKIDIGHLTESTEKTVKLIGKHLSQPTWVTVRLTVSKQSKDTTTKVLSKIVPLVLDGHAASSLQAQETMVQVTYHMEDGYRDAGDKLGAFVIVDELPEISTNEPIQLTSVEGLVVDSISPDTVNLIRVS